MYNFLDILSCWYKWYNICLISFFNLYEMFQPIISANNIGSLFNNLLGLKMSFLLFSFFFILHHLLVVALLVNKQIFHQFLLYETILLYQFFCYCIRLSFTFKPEIIIIYFKNKFLSIIFTPHFISFSIWLFILFIKIDSYMIIHTLFSLVFFFKCLCAFSLLSLFKLLKNFIK